MMKKIGILAIVALMSFGAANAVQVGDVVSEDKYERFSDTDRVTVDEVEILYTFRVFSCDQKIVDSVYDGGYTTTFKSSDELQLTIEKAIPLTGNYNIRIDINNLLIAIDEDKKYSWGGYVDSWKKVPLIVIGDSCFEDNELVESFCLDPDDVCRNIKIGKRAFYGAINLQRVSCTGSSGSGDNEMMNEVFKRLKLESIDESAFEGCENLVGIGFDCDALKRIEKWAFKNCSNFGGIVSDWAQMQEMFSWWTPGPYELKTPVLDYIGEQAFYNTLTPKINDYGEYLDRIGVKWSFQNKDIIIEDDAFYMCAFLRAIYFPSNMERIVEKSFSGLNFVDLFEGRVNKGYKTRLYFPDTLVAIGDEAFYNSVVTIDKWPSSLIEIGNSAFQNYSSISYSPNTERTELVQNLNCEWISGLPLILAKLGDGAFAGSIFFGSVPEYRPGVGMSFNGKLGLISSGALCGELKFPLGLKTVPYGCFSGNVFLETVELHDSVTNIGDYAFNGCSMLNLIVPKGVLVIGANAGASSRYSNGIIIPGPKSVIFEGKPPKGIVQSGFLECPQLMVSVEYASDWAPYFRPNMKFAKKVNGEWVVLGGKVISNAMRPSDPTIMDIKYKVTSTKDKVNVRILAFEDGNRSFAKVLRPETFVDGTEANVGDGVTANVEHTISWQVSKDWDVDLAKVSIEVYVQEDNLLPLQLTTIPAMGERASVTFSRNVPGRDKVMNALYWLYADKAADLTLANGVLKCGNTQLVNGSTLSDANAVSYIYSKMGYGMLSGDTLKYVNELMRMNLNPGGITQYAVKEGAAQ